MLGVGGRAKPFVGGAMMPAGDLQPFGAQLRRYRRSAGLTHEALAERAGVSARTISDLERGIARAPRRGTLELLTAALQLTGDAREALISAASTAVPAKLPHPPHALPPYFTSFIGRETETRGLRALLGRPEIRLVTLTGTGGVGKTRLALHAAASLGSTFPDGVEFVPLAQLSAASEIARAVAQTLGIDVPAGVAPGDAIAAALRRRRMLLLLDNFEHLLDGAALVTDLLTACPGLTVLVTSRAPLRLSAEREMSLGPLPLPDLDHLPSIEALAGYASVALFLERAERVRPDLRLSRDNAAVIAAVCARLDGLPLALELAAARVKLLSPRALLARLDGPDGATMHVLSDGARDLPARQRTLWNTIAWSYDLLSEDEQRLFRRLSVFAGGCDFAAIEAICLTGTTATRPAIAPIEMDVLDGLTSLLDKSLIHRDEFPECETRVDMLETVRAFAAVQLTASGEAETIRAAHARHFLHMVERAGAVLVGAAQQPVRLAAERDNIRRALRWLVEAG